MAKWWEIEAAINDAMQNVNYVRSEVAFSLPDDTLPGDYDPAIMELLANLDRINEQFKTVFPDQIKKAIREEAAYDDEMSDRADAMSY